MRCLPQAIARPAASRPSAAPAALAVLASLALPAAAAAQSGPAKVAVVVSGDPDEALREAAARVDRIVEATEGLIGPADYGLREALRGEPAPEEEDGLERARRARRQLGWGEARDLSGVVELGRMANADAVIVVRRAGGGLEAVAVDVRARGYFEGSIAPAEAPRDAIAEFVGARAKAAAHRPKDATAPPPTEAAETAAEPPPGGPAAGGSGEPGEPQEESSWIARNWPYLVGAALLVGTVLYFALRDDGTDATPQPMLRFRPGGDR